jgi:hypothetical protein
MNSVGFAGSYQVADSTHHPRFAKDTDMMQSAVASQGWITATSDCAAGADSEKSMAKQTPINLPIRRLAPNIRTKREVRSGRE